MRRGTTYFTRRECREKVWGRSSRKLGDTKGGIADYGQQRALTPEQFSEVTGTVQDTDDHQLLTFNAVSNNMLPDSPEQVTLVGYVRPSMSHARESSKSLDCVVNLVIDPVGGIRVVLSDVVTDQIDICVCLPGDAIVHCAYLMRVFAARGAYERLRPRQASRHARYSAPLHGASHLIRPAQSHRSVLVGRALQGLRRRRPPAWRTFQPSHARRSAFACHA